MGFDKYIQKTKNNRHFTAVANTKVLAVRALHGLLLLGGFGDDLRFG